MASEGIEKIKKIKMVPIPEKIKVPEDIPASKLRIPSTYAEGDFEYEDENGNHVSEDKATHLRFTGKDNRSDLVVGPVENRGMFKLSVYMDNENHAVRKEEASHVRQVILNDNYKAIRY
ncbi:MAG: hypothetical protein ACPK7O_04625 [Methanobacterium sp.]